jgi:hypothetical protein
VQQHMCTQLSLSYHRSALATLSPAGALLAVACLSMVLLHMLKQLARQQDMPSIKQA